MNWVEFDRAGFSEYVKESRFVDRANGIRIYRNQNTYSLIMIAETRIYIGGTDFFSLEEAIIAANAA